MTRLSTPLHSPRATRTWALTAASLAAAILIAACGGGGDASSESMKDDPVSTSSGSSNSNSNSSGGAASNGGAAMLKLNTSGLEDLGPDAVYEGWLIRHGEVVSTGRFSVDASTDQSGGMTFPVSVGDADQFILTIEPSQNDDPAPSKLHLLAGDFSSKRADLSVSHGSALGTDFKTAMGSFVLATPSSMTMDDENQGIWFVKPVDGMPKASLTLPTLPPGWVYEGWVVVNGEPMTTGRFKSPGEADDDMAGPAAGPGKGPMFPGQDFINPAKMLPGGMAVISVEPEQDNSPKPFTIKPLAGMIGMATGPMNPHMLASTVLQKSLPSGRVELVP